LYTLECNTFAFTVGNNSMGDAPKRSRYAIAMTVFRSPDLSLLGRYATPAELPLAGSLVTLAGGIITALKPFASKPIAVLI
jgi:hypothetical protein